MPIFEYVSRECKHPFEALVNGSSAPACPECESTDLSRQLSVFAMGGNGKALAAREPAGPCGSCGDPRGPGSCSLG